MFRLSPVMALSFLMVLPSSHAQVPSPAQPCANVKSESGSVAKPDCVDPTKSAKRVKVEFEGLRAFKVSDVLKALRDDDAKLPDDRLPTESEIDQATAKIKKLLKTRGYYDASITAAPITDSELRFVVNEGTRFSIGLLSFEGNRKITSGELKTNLQQHLDNYAEALKEGYDEDIFDYCHRQLMTFVRARGYLQARYIKPRITPSGTSLNITIPIEEGPTYRLGKVTVEGATAFSKTELESLFPIHNGELADAEKISKWLYEELRNAYGDKGFIQYSAEIEPKFNSSPAGDEDGLVDILITIDEGKRFKVSSIGFRGDQLSPNELTSLILLRPGDFFNEQLFEESVKRLNGSGTFEELDRDKDSNFATNDEDATVAIVLNVKRKVRN